MPDHVAGALESIRVIDFGHYIAGPLAAMLLADHGAEVITLTAPAPPLRSLWMLITIVESSASH